MDAHLRYRLQTLWPRLIPEIVLIHGSWMGGWCWRELAACLRARGARCATPTLTGLGDREHLWPADVDLNLHVQDVLNACHFGDFERPMLVGHSYGALVAMGVADRLGARCAGLFNIDGFLVEPGQSAFSAYPDVQALLAPFIGVRDEKFIEPLPIAHMGIEEPHLIAEFMRKAAAHAVGDSHYAASVLPGSAAPASTHLHSFHGFSDIRGDRGAGSCRRLASARISGRTPRYRHRTSGTRRNPAPCIERVAVASGCCFEPKWPICKICLRLCKDRCARLA